MENDLTKRRSGIGREEVGLNLFLMVLRINLPDREFRLGLLSVVLGDYRGVGLTDGDALPVINAPSVTQDTPCR